MTPEQQKHLQEQVEILLDEMDIDLELGATAKELSQTMVHSISEPFEIFENQNGDTVYAITSLQDFLKVPEDRLEDCLKDFKVGCDMLRPVYELAQVLGQVIGAEGEALMQRKFHWIDDGIHGEEAATTVSLQGMQIDGDSVRIQMGSPEANNKKVE